ncbi:MAG: RsmD family RNA methyltransferase [Deltaproteobacteria bacterium]|nr:RsmD family RNA methyltransferase [Deltaproteobacteria bacterium]
MSSWEKNPLSGHRVRSAGSALRIIGGSLGGRRFGRPAPCTRPTSDRVREAAASIVLSRCDLAGAQVLDLFAGTGSYAFEFLSRGASQAVLIDRDARAVADIQASALALGLSARIRVIRAEVGARRTISLLEGSRFQVVVVDPPYDGLFLGLDAMRQLAQAQCLEARAILVLEHRGQDAKVVEESVEVFRFSAVGLTLESQHFYGDTGLTVFMAS